MTSLGTTGSNKDTIATRRQWFLLIGLSLGPAVSNGIARFAYGLVLPAMQNDLAWTYTQAGWIGTANALGYLAGSVLAYWIIARTGPQRMFIIGLLVTVAALLLTATTRNFSLLTVWRLAAGIGGAAVLIAGGAIASTLFRDDARRNALAIAIYFGGAGLGLLLPGTILPLMLERLGASAWPEAWFTLGMLGVVLLVPTIYAARALESVRPDSPVAASRIPSFGPARLPLRKMAPALLSYTLFAMGYIVYLTFLTAWMQSQGFEAALVALTWAMLGTAVMLSPFPWRGLLSTSNGGKALAWSSAGTACGTLIPLVITGPSAVVVSASLFGLSFFIVPTAVVSFGKKNLDQSLWGTSFALFTTLFAVGQTIGPVIAGAIGDMTGSITTGLAAAGIIILAAAGIAAMQSPFSPSSSASGNTQ